MISIIIPIHNGEKYINTCLTSILQQTYTDIEIIIIDDGSTDNTSQICKKLFVQDKRIRVYGSKLNKGVSFSRNWGIKLARGEYICFIDIDDTFYSNNALELLYNPLYDLICGNFELIKNKELIKDKFVLCTEPTVLDRSAFLEKTCEYINRPYGNNNLYSTVWSKLYKTSIIKQNNLTFYENVNKDEDVAFCIKFATYVSSCLIIPDIVYVFSQEDDQSKQKRYDKGGGNMVFNMVAVFRTAERFLSEIEVPTARKNELLINFMNYYLNRYLYYNDLLELLP
jgi:glycosyltransferase involved in cell wall biosynthesis